MATLKAGSKGNLNASMAKEIKDAFLENWEAYMGEETEPPDLDDPQFELLVVAIAQGVINHLKNKEKAFEVQYQNSKDTTHSIEIQTTE